MFLTERRDIWCGGRGAAGPTVGTWIIVELIERGMSIVVVLCYLAFSRATDCCFHFDHFDEKSVTRLL